MKVTKTILSLVLSGGVLSSCGSEPDFQEQQNSQPEAGHDAVVEAAPMEGELSHTLEEQPSEDPHSFNIINGQTPETAVAQRTVAIRAGNSLCSGTIVSENHIVTASHCLETTSPADFAVHFGSSALNPTAVRDVAKIDYRGIPGSVANGQDIAVFTLTAPIPAGYTAATLPEAGMPLTENTPVKIAGYGLTNSNGTGAGTQLQGSAVIVGITAAEIQTQPGPTGQSLCQGDSGGPTFVTVGGELIVVGVTSRGNANCTNAYSTDYRFHRSWLDGILSAGSGGGGLDLCASWPASLGPCPF